MSFRQMVETFDEVTLDEAPAEPSAAVYEDDYVYYLDKPPGARSKKPAKRIKPAICHSTTARQGRWAFEEFEEYRRISCELCGKEDSSKWIVVDPEVLSEAEMSFRIYLPAAGDYECSILGVRLETKSKAIIDCKYGSWDEYISKMESDLQICGPLFDIQVKTGTVTAIHLPHFLCLQDTKDLDVIQKDNDLASNLPNKIDHSLTSLFVCRKCKPSSPTNTVTTLKSGCTPKDELKIIHMKDGNYTLVNPSAVYDNYVELKTPTFSLLSVVISKISSWLFQVHTLGMIYRTRTVGELTLHIYFVPNELSIIMAVKEQESDAVKIVKPPQVKPLSYGKTYSLTSPANIKIIPPDIDFCYLRSDQYQQFCEVYSQDEKTSIELKLSPKIKESKPLWKTLLRPMELHISPKVSLDASLAVEFIKRHRKHIIERLGVIDPYLRHLLDKNVINEDEEEEILANQKRICRNETLVRMIMKKGAYAQEQLYNAMEEHDRYLVKDLQ